MEAVSKTCWSPTHFGIRPCRPGAADDDDDDLDGDNEEDGGISSGDDEDDNEESGVGVVESKV